MSRGKSFCWAEEAEGELQYRLPKRPGEKVARDVDVSGVGALRFSAAFERTLQQTVKGKPGGGGGKQRGQQGWGQDMTQAWRAATPL